jgi:DNA anti-recombination protein RmuC
MRYGTRLLVELRSPGDYWARLGMMRRAMVALHERNPLELMQRQAESLSQRAADLKKVADAWEPPFKTLSEDQKNRMAFVTAVTARGLRETIEHRIESEGETAGLGLCP